VLSINIALILTVTKSPKKWGVQCLKIDRGFSMKRECKTQYTKHIIPWFLIFISFIYGYSRLKPPLSKMPASASILRTRKIRWNQVIGARTGFVVVSTSFATIKNSNTVLLFLFYLWLSKHQDTDITYLTIIFTMLYKSYEVGWCIRSFEFDILLNKKSWATSVSRLSRT
jgi:hypothetical protein